MTTSIALERADGTRFAVTVLRAEDDDAPLVLVVPAMGMGARWYIPLLEALRAAGCHAAVTELRGHEAEREPGGGRRAGWSYDWGYAELVDDLDQAVAALVAEGLPAPCLLGHSLGGQIASAYAALHPDAIPGLMLVASGSVHWRHWTPRHLLLTQGAALLAHLRGHFPGRLVGFADREARTQMRDWARFGRTGRLVVGGRDVGPDLAALALPVLAVSFEGDEFGTAASVDGLVGMMPSAKVTRVHVERLTDHLRWARSPEIVLPVLVDWLRDQRALPGS